MSFQGRLNTYTCPTCGWQAITIDRDEGVTPMFISCEGRRCDAETLPGAASSMYRIRVDLTKPLIPTHEWYRPTPEEIAAMPVAHQEHYRMGGLSLRKIEEEKK